MLKNTETYPVDFLTETLDLAGQTLINRFGEKLQIRSKADASLVTDADLASEAIVIERIKRYFPNDKIFSEEAGLSSKDRKPGSHIWIIDPLDGTTNFANNYPFFCVSIGRGRFKTDLSIEMTLGGIMAPLQKKIYLAALGNGAYVNQNKMSVAPSRDLKQSFLVTGFYYKRGEDLKHEIDRFAKVADICPSIRRDGSAALDLALVAEGIFDGFWELGLQPWDVAAGSLLVTEAGGTAVNYMPPQEIKKSATYNLEKDGIIVGCPSIVQAIANLIF